LWRRIRTHWNWTDTTVFGANTVAFALFIGNCWWERPWVTYLAVVLPLALEARRAWAVKDVLREALAFGAIVGGSWPLGEWLVVHTVGWWGTYGADGIMVLDTPLHTVLIGWLASAYCYYIGRRTVDIGYGVKTSGFVTGISALGLGIVGENLFVGAGMWVYDASALDWWAVPAFVPLAYGAGYALLPLFWRFPTVLRALLFNALMLVLAVGAGFAVGFFPRP